MPSGTLLVGRAIRHVEMKNASRFALILALLAGACARDEAAPDTQTAAPDFSARDALPGSDTHAALSPDGSRIAYISNIEGVLAGRPINFEIYVAERGVPAAARLTTNDAFDADIAWSPDSRRIAFKSYRDGNDEVYVMNADGSDQRNLTNSPASDGSPSWSPDGSTIVFDSNRDGGARRMYLMDADGSNVRAFANDPGPGSLAQWSPDGSQIAFISDRDGNIEIYLMRADGSDVRRLTNDPRVNGYPRWRPDSRAIAYTVGSFETDKWAAELIELDGGQPRVLVDSVDSGSTGWSPDGRGLVFGRYRRWVSNGGDDSRLHGLDVATGVAQRLR